MHNISVGNVHVSFIFKLFLSLLLVDIAYLCPSRLCGLL